MFEFNKKYKINTMSNPKCLTLRCEEEAGTRGLCANCYSNARNMVKIKMTTWEVLERKGMVLPVRKTKNNLFKEQFDLA